jgi:Na+/proline symporter
MHSITIICDSWTGPIEMCIMNFMVYYNGIIFFHKFINYTGHNQDEDFVYGVSTMFPKCVILMYVLFLINRCVSSIHSKSTKLSSSLVQNILCRS